MLVLQTDVFYSYLVYSLRDFVVSEFHLRFATAIDTVVVS